MKEELLYKKFVEWYATPERQRVPNTLQEFAEANNTSTKQLTKYYEDPAFTDDTAASMLKWASGRIPEYLAKLDERITNEGRTKDIVAFVDLVTKMSKNHQDQGNNSNIIKITPAQYEAIIQREAAKQIGLLDTSSKK